MQILKAGEEKMKCCDSQEELFELKNRITNLINRLNSTSYMIFSKDMAKLMLEEFHEKRWSSTEYLENPDA